MSHKMCSFYQSPNRAILRGSLSWEGIEPDGCPYVGTETAPESPRYVGTGTAPESRPYVGTGTAPESPSGVYSNTCSFKRQFETYIGVFGAVVSSIVMANFSKKNSLIIAYLVIALSHQIAQIGIWKDKHGLGYAMFIIAFAAATIQDTIIVVWVADNIPTKYRGQILSISIITFTVVRYIFEALESEMDYLAVTTESGACG